MMSLSGTVLLEGIRGKVEGFGPFDFRSGVVPVVRPSPKAEGFAVNSPGHRSPTGFTCERTTGAMNLCRFAKANRRGGFRAADARFVEPLARTTGTNFALLLADRLAARETELLPDKDIMV